MSIKVKEVFDGVFGDERDAAFEKAQQALIDDFKLRLKDAAENVISDLYTDIANYATSDAHINYHNFLREEFRDSLIKEVSSENGHYSWASGIRMVLLDRHPEALRNKIISDLQERIESLESQVEQLRRWK